MPRFQLSKEAVYIVIIQLYEKKVLIPNEYPIKPLYLTILGTFHSKIKKEHITEKKKENSLSKAQILKNTDRNSHLKLQLGLIYKYICGRPTTYAKETRFVKTVVTFQKPTQWQL
jgi:hypothetical protein